MIKNTLTFPNGEKYVGEFKDGKLNGHVTIKYAGKSLYKKNSKEQKF